MDSKVKEYDQLVNELTDKIFNTITSSIPEDMDKEDIVYLFFSIINLFKKKVECNSIYKEWKNKISRKYDRKQNAIVEIGEDF